MIILKALSATQQIVMPFAVYSFILIILGLHFEFDGSHPDVSRNY
jgi:hypothetical protein